MFDYGNPFRLFLMRDSGSGGKLEWPISESGVYRQYVCQASSTKTQTTANCSSAGASKVNTRKFTLIRRGEREQGHNGLQKWLDCLC